MQRSGRRTKRKGRIDYRKLSQGDTDWKSDEDVKEKPKKASKEKQNTAGSQQESTMKSAPDSFKRDIFTKMSIKITDLSHSESDDSSMEDEIDTLLQITENVWVQCENLNCLKWRKVPKDHAGQFDQDTSWFCLMNPDFNFNECSKPEENHSLYEKIAAKAGIKFILSQLENGELVWAKTAGYCRWPAVITKDPYSGLHITLDVDGDPYAYRVVYLGNPHSHCWVPVHNVEIYGHQYRITKDMTKRISSVNCRTKGKKKGKQSRGMMFSDKIKGSYNQYKIGDAIEEADSLLPMSKDCRLQRMVYEYETRIFEHSDMQRLDKSHQEKFCQTSQNKSSHPASNPQQNMLYVRKKRATRYVESTKPQCLDQTVPDMSINTCSVFNQVNERDMVKVFVPYCQVTESLESVGQAEKHSKSQVTEQRKSVKQLKHKKTKRCKEKRSIKKQQTSSHNCLPDCVEDSNAAINSVNIQSAEDFLYCSEDINSIMEHIETHDGNENPIDTDPFFIRDDFDSMMKAIDEDIKCSSQLEQELLDTGINQDFHNELTNYSDGMEYLTYFSPPLLDKGNEDNTPSDTPQWLRASADYLEQQHKDALTVTGDQELGEVEKDTTSPTAPLPPDMSPRSLAAAAALRTTLVQGLPISEALTTMTTSVSSVYTASTVTTTSTTVSPSVSPAAYPGIAQLRPPPPPVDIFQKQSVPISSPDMFLKSASVPTSQFQAYHPGTQRIPPISHLSPKHIRQTHMEHNMSMSLPVSLAPLSLNKDMSKESLSTAEVESQIAILESQIAAVNRSLKQTAQVTGVEPVLQTPTPASKSTRRKADSSSDEHGSYGPPPYPKKTRQQSPVSANRASVESTNLPPLHSSMDMLARIHRLDTDSIPESLRSQNIQSTLEAFEALRTQTFPPNSEVMRTQVSNDVETIQNTAQDMSIHHAIAEREQLAAYSASVEREQVYPVTAAPTAVVREQSSYTPSPTERDAATNAAYTAQGSSVHVKVEAGQSDDDSVGEPSVQNISADELAAHQAALLNAHGAQGSGEQTYPVSMYAAATNESATADDKLAAEISTKKMRRKFLESMKNSNPKYYSHQIQQIIPFPEKFPVANLDYGLKALQMIQTGEITRGGKIQLIDTIFHELIKYTGLYPFRTQKMSVANAIVETFPTLAAKMKASHISPADSWYVILCNKFRNERRGLSGSPRVSRSPKVPKHEHDPSGLATDLLVSMEATEEATVEVRTTEEELADETSQHMSHTPPSSVSQATPPLQHQNQQSYDAESAAAVAAVAAYHQAYSVSQVGSVDVDSVTQS